MKRFKIVSSLIKERLKLKRGAEIGVWKGETSEYLLSNHGKLHLICIDPYEYYSHYDTFHDLGQYDTQLKLDGLYEVVSERLKRRFGDRVKFIRKRSVEASRDIKDGSLDFAFLDANYGYDWVKNDILAWLPKVRNGGVIIGQNIASNKDGPGCVRRAVVDTLGRYKVKDGRWYYVC